MGKVNKSPDEFLSPIIFFAISTPINPPNSPPIIDFTFSIWSKVTSEVSKNGYSKNPMIREPIKAPKVAPIMIDSLLFDEILSVLFFRRKT